MKKKCFAKLKYAGCAMAAGPAQGERKWRGGRGLLPPWDVRKVEFSSPETRLWPAVPVYLVHSAVTRGVPKPPVLCIVIGVGRI